MLLFWIHIVRTYALVPGTGTVLISSKHLQLGYFVVYVRTYVYVCVYVEKYMYR